MHDARHGPSVRPWRFPPPRLPGASIAAEPRATRRRCPRGRRWRRAGPERELRLTGAAVRVLAGDAGGTNTRVAVFEATAGAPAADALRLVEARRYASRDAAGLGEIVAQFLAETGLRGERACFGVAGPVRDGQVRATNLPWNVDAAEVASAAGLPAATLLNDLEANAWGLRALPAAAFVTLQAGAPDAAGNAALISAGTGLGEAGLHWDGGQHRPFACEGGHATFAPRTPLEVELLEHLARRFGHVSWERVLSGPGLANVWRFLLERRGAAEPAWAAEAERNNGLGAEITKAGLAGSDAVCAEALDLFVGFYGAEAGNLALKMLATGGVYVGGGIAPKIRSRIEGAAFLEAFRDKGRMRPLLEAMPVRLVIDDRAALFGAAWYAAFVGGTSPR
jgi:glucokinase